MEMDFKEYIPWIGGLVFGLVALHALYLFIRSRRARRAEREAEADQGGDSLAPVLRETLDGQPDDADPPAQRFAEVSAADDDVGATESPSQSEATDLSGEPASTPTIDATTTEQPRFVIPGKRTEPTVPREQRPLQTETPAPAPPQAVDQVVVLWVTAKTDATLDGRLLVRTLQRHGLEHSNGVFYKLEENTNGEQYMVANGVEPGTFDVANIDALATPRIALLLRLANAANPTQAFEDMLNVAQDVQIALGAEIQDEAKTTLNSQIIDQYRRRIRDYKRLAQKV